MFMNFGIRQKKERYNDKYYSRSKIRCTEDHAKPTSTRDPDHMILQVGKNGQLIRKNPDEIAESIVQLASALKTKSCNVSISSITTKNDQYRKKAIEVNKKLTNLCLENNLHLIHNGSTINTKHVNWSKLYLRKKCTRILFNNFKEAISNILQ